MTVIVKKQTGTSKQVHPYIHYLKDFNSIILLPNQSIYQSLFLSLDKTGWVIADPTSIKMGNSMYFSIKKDLKVLTFMSSILAGFLYIFFEYLSCFSSATGLKSPRAW